MTARTVSHQAPLSMGFSRREYCSGLPFPSPGDHPDPEIESKSPVLQADSLPVKPPGKLKTTVFISLSSMVGRAFIFLLSHGLMRLPIFCVVSWAESLKMSLCLDAGSGCCLSLLHMVVDPPEAGKLFLVIFSG